MWTFILLYTLGLNICQATGEDNSTQMYYVKLIIDKSAIDNITAILTTPFVRDNNLIVENLDFTTTCKSVSAGKKCTCSKGYRWRDRVYHSDENDCSGDKCTFTQNLNPMCISDNTVNINGSLTLYGMSYHDCLSNKEDKVINCTNNLLQKMKEVYSTLSGFDSIAIGNYSVGSIIADFTMTIAAPINTDELSSKSEELEKKLKDPKDVNGLDASIFLETRGIVKLSIPSGLVLYNSNATISCSTTEDLGKPKWHLKTDYTNVITTGTESEVIINGNESTVKLNYTSERWAGEYTCTYKKGHISHKASAVLRVSLLPNIRITTDPSFPRCQRSNDLRHVTVKCEIRNSSETYKVNWSDKNINSKIDTFIPSPPEKILSYEAKTFVGCQPPIPNVTCTFKNRLNQTRKAEIEIITINVNDAYCEADGEWEETKANYTAVLQCKNAAGQKKRKCNEENQRGIWGPVESACVNLEVNDVLERAITADVGLGELADNAAIVFSRLQNVTNSTDKINSFANMNASVEVLVSMSSKLNHIHNESTVNDVLESSSNLLEESLSSSWGTDNTKSGHLKTNEGEGSSSHVSLAERYLSSVEQLIVVANFTTASRKKNIEVEERNCTQGSQCTNKVFNVNVSLHSSTPDSVKTAGMKQLEKYLPYNDTVEPNSIVVTATTKGKQTAGVRVTIDFALKNPRAPNTQLLCVYWSNNTRSWSEDGCWWEGPSEVGRCVCQHLSSFAMLVSKTPLTIPGITEITYVGLSVSIVSLIISLVIEMSVWSALVKTNSLYLRHTAHINISVCLLVADCCFLASSTPEKIDQIWCKTSVVLKHFCYLSMFFWMLCLSTTLLHKAVFPFHNLSKRNYLRFSLVLGYVCPLLIVVITFIANDGGAEDLYFSKRTCWLVYKGFMKGSIHTFLIPIGIIIFVNVFSMLVVIMKLLDHPKNIQKSNEKEKTAAKTVMRSVILLTPIFGGTWIFGFAVTILDLTYGNIAFVVNYAFTLLNAFQGLFILLTTCLGEKQTREALLNRFRNKTLASTASSSTKLDSTWKK
ncbi:adhesion G protein-coupled receptor F4 isoform X1 [Thunnus maccoyii]|uniref:adhesion G protein-coupled receptor F4 isoform X1 n=1 Tax=Thunnus maccoyii TaxID=8240 RepID=UPI001C4B2313|nr:adhesion G protein-coupled receptor F4 isoform X1 [Thunnus maccoyii]XP_042293043.1 adhesion G protein-coupled receptor F4 isoform X1 [Thunnus maccoyii]